MIFDGDERMGVHGVVMIEIANHQRIDGREFRKEPDQDSGQCMARSASVACGATRICWKCSHRPGIAAPSLASAGRRLQLLLGLAAESQAIAGYHSERAEKLLCILETARLRTARRPAETVYGEFENACSPFAEAIRREIFSGTASSRSCVASVRWRARGGNRSASSRRLHGRVHLDGQTEVCGHGLQFVSERVVVAALAEMQQAARRGEKVEGASASALSFGEGGPHVAETVFRR